MPDDPPPYRAGDPVRAGIPEHGRVPRYYALKADLLDLIDTLGEGAGLPSEREIAERFEVSRMTVRQAVGELVLEGRLQRRQGAGTFVAPPKLEQPFGLVSYTEDLRKRGFETSRALITLEHIVAGGALATELGVRPGAMVVHVERVLLADGERVGLESIYLAADRYPDLVATFDPATSLYNHLRDRYGVRFAEADERVETVLATPREALLIGTNPALPMLLLNRLSRDPSGEPIERGRSLFRGDRFSLVAHLRG